MLYNPHWNPGLSSWPQFGLRVLAFFAAHPQRQLIFAPHVLLTGPRRPLDLAQYAVYRNIHIDLGSTAAVDMSYTAAADIYLGDVSSQVYEFLSRPRPCLFLNPGVRNWQADSDYLHWGCGPVWSDQQDIGAGLAFAVSSHARFLPVQRALFEQTFSLTAEPSSNRAAAAIVRLLKSPPA